MNKEMTSLVERVCDIITEKAKECGRIIVAIDGRCASGKTTLAAKIAEILPCNVIHGDEFFLRREQRTEDRLSTPGENIDHERLLEEVLIPLKNGEDFSYRPFDCKRMDFGESVFVENKNINIIEGSYSCHEKLRGFYDLCIFLNVSEEEQMKRITERNGEEAAEVFRMKWIPLEEKYFKAFDIPDLCDYRFET